MDIVGFETCCGVVQLAMLKDEAEVLEAQKLKGAETSGGPSRLVHGSGSRSRRGS